MNMIRPWLFVGALRATQDADALKQHGIGAMLQLHRPAEQPGIETLYVAVQEGYRMTRAEIKTGVDFVLEQKAQGRRVLVACGSGISRSATFALAALKVDENLGLGEAFLEVRKQYDRAMPDEVHWHDLCQYFGEDVDFWSLWVRVEL